MKAMIKFLISAGFAVVFVACSTESSTQATSTTPVIGKAYAEMVASTRCDNTDKDSHCNEASKALRKVSFQNGGFTNVATVFDDPSGDKMTVRWKDDKEMFIVVPGVSAYTWDQTAVSENASTRKIPYQVTEILSNGTDAKFAPIYIGDDSTEYKYCEKNATSCIALYPAGNFWTEPGNVAPRIGNRLKVQQYKEYTDHMRDSVSKYHHMVSAINAWGDNSLHVYFEQLTSFVEVDLPRTENVKIVGFKGRSVGYSNTTVQEYEIHFKDAIPSGDGTGESIRVVFAIPPVMGSITGDLAFYTKTGEDDNSPIVYKKRLKSELKLSDNSNGGAYWSFDFSTLTGVAEEQNSSSSSDQSSSSQGGSEEPENPEGSSSSQTSSSSSGSDNPSRIEKSGDKITFTEAGTFTVYIGGKASDVTYCNMQCSASWSGTNVKLIVNDVEGEEGQTSSTLNGLPLIYCIDTNVVFKISGVGPFTCYAQF